MQRIVFPGVTGCYSYLAASRHYPGHRPQGARDFVAVVAAVRSGKAALGILPVENTVVGPIVEARAALDRAADLVTVGEVVFPVNHCLLALPGARLETLRWVESHPAALAQCARWLSARQLTPREVEDTAGAARDIAVDRDFTRGAIASAEAGDLYGLVILAREIADAPANVTRFVVVARGGEGTGP